MYTDMVGYTALGQRNESLSLALVEEQRKLIRPILARHNGREIKTMGDAFLVEFPNATDSVRCAYDIQRAIREFNLALASDKRIHLRIGIHLGEVVESQGDISGDAVNVASRIYPLAEDGGVCLTRQIYDQVRGKFELPQVSLGPKPLKNVSEPMEVFKLVMPWDQSAPAEAASYPINRIAVLPFVSLSPDPNDEYFADGLTEEMIAELSTLPGLGVIARTSVMHYKRTDRTVKEIAKELGVGSVLEGSVRKAGDRIRITAQLIQAKDEQHLWAERYDRSLQDIFEVQSEIAQSIARTLKMRLAQSETPARQGQESLEVFFLVLRGRFELNKGTKEGIWEGIRFLEEALRLDPESGRVYSGLADCYVMAGERGIRNRDESFAKARQMVDRALELNRELADAHATNGVLLWNEYEYDRAEEELKLAISLNPNLALAHTRYAQLLLDLGRYEEALTEIKKAIESDPLSLPIMNSYAYYFHFSRRNDEWLTAINRLIQVHPEFPGGYLQRAWANCWLRNADEARHDMEAYFRLSKDELNRGVFEATLEALLGNDRRARDLISTGYLNADGPSHEDARPPVYPYALIGDREEFFKWAEFAIRRKKVTAGELRYDPCLDRIKADPRFKELFKRFNLPG
jgi:adenylate cyclase